MFVDIYCRASKMLELNFVVLNAMLLLADYSTLMDV